MEVSGVGVGVKRLELFFGGRGLGGGGLVGGGLGGWDCGWLFEGGCWRLQVDFLRLEVGSWSLEIEFGGWGLGMGCWGD